MNTVFNYLYRDADNYKTWNNVVLEGAMDDSDYEKILSCCDCDHTFVPENIGLDLIRDWEYDPETDHPWCEVQPYELTEAKSCGLTVKELVDRFEKRKEHWDDVMPSLMAGF